MAFYSQSAVFTQTSAAAPSWDIKTAGMNNIRVTEVSITVSVATATSAYGIGRPGNDGSVAQSNGVSFVPDNAVDPPASQTLLATTWTTAPTVPVAFYRRAYLPSTLNAGILWTFPRGLYCVANRGLVAWNIGASTAQGAVYIELDE
jgi:hypothetical protein